MGIHVGVRFLARRVTDFTWDGVYADSLRLLREWPVAPLGVGYREVAGARVMAYTRAFEREDGWRIIGDAVSRLHADSFDLPKRLPPLRERSQSGTNEESLDVLAALADEAAGGPSRLSCLLGGKTKGYPYHCLLVAVATLIEHRLPRVAVARGDFNREHAALACSELTRIFGERFELPILLEPERIRLRVPNIDTDKLSRHHTRQLTHTVFTRLYDKLMNRVDDRLRRELEQVVPGCTNASGLSDPAREFLCALGSRMAEIWRDCSAKPDVGLSTRRELLREIAAGTERQCICLTEPAWEAIEACAVDTLRFLTHLGSLKAEQLYMHQAVVAAYESSAIRDLVMASWQTALAAP